jgi:hypothetical protein
MSAFLLGVGLGLSAIPGDHQLYNVVDGSHRSIGTAGVAEARVVWIPHDLVHLDIGGDAGIGRDATLLGFTPQLDLGWSLGGREVRPYVAGGVRLQAVRGDVLGDDSDWGRHVALGTTVPFRRRLSARLEGRRARMPATGGDTTAHHSLTLGLAWRLEP